MLKILYAGSPEPAAKTLQILLEKQTEYDFQIVGVLSNPPSAKGRHKELTPTPVAACAIEKGIPVFTPEHLDAECRKQIEPLQADLLFCFAYGHIFGPKFLNMFKFGGINLHPSLLPKYRGCTPVNAAILNRDKETAVTIQTLSLKMDEGDILAQKKIELTGQETAPALLDSAAEIGAELVCQVINQAKNENPVDGDIPQLGFGKKQEGEPSYTGIITKEDGKINWSDSADNIEAKIRAYYGDPGCWADENELPLKISVASVIEKSDARYTKYADDEPGKVLDFVKADGIYIKTGDGILCVKELQRQGKKVMNYKDFMNGARDFVGTLLK